MNIDQTLERIKSIIQNYEFDDGEDYLALNIASSALRAQRKAKANPGEVSDGYHTFNELYHHRAVLFSVICNEHPELAWKSKRHSDGSMYDGMFIVGIDTPDGPATYHYDVEPYWEMFRVKELDRAPEWDGHTPAQAIERIGSLGAVRNEPLTLDQLLEMDGQPVWLEHPDGYKHYDGWTLVFVSWKAQKQVRVTYATGGSGDVSLLLDTGAKIYRRPPEKEESHGY